MQVSYNTNDGPKYIEARTFFPAEKRVIEALLKEMLDHKNSMGKAEGEIVFSHDMSRIETAISKIIKAVEPCINDFRARSEIWEMSAKEELVGSFEYKVAARRAQFFRTECERAKDVLRALNQNLEDLHGKG